MPKTTHTVALPCGRTAKRVSASRVYPFVLVGRWSLSVALANAQAAHMRKSDLSNFRYYGEVATAQAGETFTHPARGPRDPSWSTKYDAQQIAAAAQRVAGHASAEAYAAAQLAARLAKIEEQKAAGAFERFEALTWSSRRDLADKARSQFGAHEDFRILETVRS